jgi:hypothetical protein
VKKRVKVLEIFTILQMEFLPLKQLRKQKTRRDYALKNLTSSIKTGKDLFK